MKRVLSDQDRTDATGSGPGGATPFAAFEALGPQGFALALHIRGGRATLVRFTFCDGWRDHYWKNSYFLRDPLLRWGLANTGVVDWQDLGDAWDMLAEARDFGLVHWTGFSVGHPTDRSILSIARTERALTEKERGAALAALGALHSATQVDRVITPAQIEALRRVAGGERCAEAAHALGISESALKARLKAARDRLAAKTTAQAIRNAQTFNLI